MMGGINRYSVYTQTYTYNLHRISNYTVIAVKRTLRFYSIFLPITALSRFIFNLVSLFMNETITRKSRIWCSTLRE